MVALLKKLCQNRPLQVCEAHLSRTVPVLQKATGRAAHHRTMQRSYPLQRSYPGAESQHAAALYQRHLEHESTSPCSRFRLFKEATDIQYCSGSLNCLRTLASSWMMKNKMKLLEAARSWQTNCMADAPGAIEASTRIARGR